MDFGIIDKQATIGLVSGEYEMALMFVSCRVGQNSEMSGRSCQALKMVNRLRECRKDGAVFC